MNVIARMREDWDRRAKQDANYYVAFARENQDEGEFLDSGNEIAASFEAEFFRLPHVPSGERRALEIGCGPGRLMLPMSRHFDEIHGVDISTEMAALARAKLAAVPNASVHVNSGSDLSLFPEGRFDFIYSWTVFQHIPSKEVVLDYLRESRRVLKPGGVLACQLRGVRPVEDELTAGAETWTGCWFSAAEIFAFAEARNFSLVAISGIDTQYMMTVFRKPASESRSSARPVLKAVTGASSGDARIPARGREAAVSLWLEGFPPDGGLQEFPVAFGGNHETGCFLSPVTPEGGCQLNCRLPAGVTPGTLQVSLTQAGRPLTAACPVEVLAPPPRDPKIVLVTDRVNLRARDRVENGGMQVTMEDLDAAEVPEFEIDGRKPVKVLSECRDPITSTYVFGFQTPPGVLPGRHVLRVTIGRRSLAAELRIVS